jgi:hypothetical protein
MLVKVDTLKLQIDNKKCEIEQMSGKRDKISSEQE